MRAWPDDVRLFALAYTGAADQGHMGTALDLKRRWPAGLVQCSCEGGVVLQEDDCQKCGGVGLYYQPESEVFEDRAVRRAAVIASRDEQRVRV
jgi:hypothetical protein